MDEEEFMKTNVNTAFVIKIDLNSLKGFKKKMIELVNEYDSKIIYHTSSPYKLKIKEEDNK